MHYYYIINQYYIIDHKLCVALAVDGGGGCYMQVITYSSFQKKALNYSPFNY